MKIANVRYIGQSENIHSGVLIENQQDINELIPITDKYEERVINKIVCSKLPNDALGHLISGLSSFEKPLGVLAITRGKMKQCNALYEVGDAKIAYINTLIKTVNSVGSVFLNKNGGICPVEGTLEIVSVTEQDFKHPDLEAYIPYGQTTSVINLENDFELEKHSINYMRDVLDDCHYSYITDLRLYSREALTKQFRRFKEREGHTVYIYTTGRDVEQMYLYSGAAIEAGLAHFIFDFNSGVDEGITTFIEWLKQRANVEIVNKP